MSRVKALPPPCRPCGPCPGGTFSWVCALMWSPQWSLRSWGASLQGLGLSGPHFLYLKTLVWGKSLGDLLGSGVAHRKPTSRLVHRAFEKAAAASPHRRVRHLLSDLCWSKRWNIASHVGLRLSDFASRNVSNTFKSRQDGNISVCARRQLQKAVRLAAFSPC